MKPMTDKPVVMGTRQFWIDLALDNPCDVAEHLLELKASNMELANTIYLLQEENESLKHDNARQAETQSELATENTALRSQIEGLNVSLMVLEPYLDSVICYASTITEYPPNGAVKAIRDHLAALEPGEEK